MIILLHWLFLHNAYLRAVVVAMKISTATAPIRIIISAIVIIMVIIVTVIVTLVLIRIWLRIVTMVVVIIIITGRGIAPTSPVAGVSIVCKKLVFLL